MDEDKKEVVEETIEEIAEETIEETPKYILSTPKSPDMFIMTRILGKIGINKFKSCLHNEDVQKLVKEMKEKNVIELDMTEIAGIGVFTEVAQIVIEGMDKCEEDIYKLLSNTSNLTIEEVKSLDGVTFVEMIIDFFKTNLDFIKAASKLFNKVN